MLGRAERVPTSELDKAPAIVEEGEGGSSKARILIVSPKKSTWRRMADLWAHRELLVFLVRKELTVKYKNSVLGFLWSMLNPALTLAVYYFVFQLVLKNGIPGFPIYLMCGLLVWNLFSSAVPAAATAVVSNSAIVKKVAFPREILAIAAIGASLIFFVFQAIVLLLAMAVFHYVPAASFLPLLIPAMIALLLFSGALAIFLSAVNVYLRDTQHLLEVALMAWFWATPIVYSYQTIAAKLRAYHVLLLYFLNPIAPIVLTFQRTFYAKVVAVTTVTVNGVTQHGKLPILPTWHETTYLYLLLMVIAVSAGLSPTMRLLHEGEVLGSGLVPAAAGGKSL